MSSQQAFFQALIASGGYSAIAQAFKTRVEADSGTFEGLSCLIDEITELGSFYESASFILTSNGVKTSKIYALKPTDGSADLTFSRSSAGYRTSSNTTIQSQVTNLPRLDYFDKLCPFLLLEASRTNLLLRSEEFDNSSWVKINLAATPVIANAIVAPDGTTTADKIIEGSTSASHFIRQNITKAASPLPYTISGFFKKAEREWIRFFGWDGASNGVEAWFNLNTGEKGSFRLFGSGWQAVDYDIFDYGNGWYYCWMRIRSNTATTISWAAGLSTGDLVSTYLGDGSSGLYMWGASVKQIVTIRVFDSYIQTTTTAVTRNSDSISALTSISNLIGQTQGTFYLKLSNWSDNDSLTKVISLSDGTANNYISIEFTSLITAKVVSGGVTQATLVSNIFLPGFECKIVVTYQNNKAALFVNGSKIAEDLSVTVPACSQLRFTDSGGANTFFGNLDDLGFSKTALSDASAQTLSTVDAMSDLLVRTPAIRWPGNPMIEHDATYINICPSRVMQDPLDSSKFLLYEGQFLGPTTVGARVKLKQGAMNNPFSASTDLGVIAAGSEAYDTNGCRYGEIVEMSNGNLAHFYVGIDASYNWTICRAESSDGGRSFTKQGIVISPNGVDEFGLSLGPCILKEGSRWYMAYTAWSGPVNSVPNNNPGTSSIGIKLAYSDDQGFTWVKTGIKLVSLGATGADDAATVEDCQFLKIGEYYTLIYNGSNAGGTWRIFMAYSKIIDKPNWTKSTKRFFDLGGPTGSTLVACPSIFDFGGSLGKKMYYQGASGTPIDIGAASFFIV